jgi:hypothetical protein
VLLGDVVGGGRPPGGGALAVLRCRARVDEDRSGGVGDGVEQRQRCVGSLWRGDAVGGKANAGGASGNGLPGELGFALALQGLRGRRPSTELGWQSRSCFLPGGDGGEGIAGGERLKADGARKRHERPIDGQAASTLIGIVIPRIDIEGGLRRELDAPAIVLPARLGKAATPL